VGGAIRNPRTFDIEPPVQAVEHATVTRPSLVEMSYDSMRPRLPTVMHGAPRILLEAGLPHFMLQLPSYSDEFLLKDLKKVARPGGAANHSAEVRQVVFESFEKHPALLQHYLQDAVGAS
jgi:hypothetical protein